MSDEMSGCEGMTTTALLSLPFECPLHTAIPTYSSYPSYRMWRIGWPGQKTCSISCTTWLRYRRCGAPDQPLA